MAAPQRAPTLVLPLLTILYNLRPLPPLPPAKMEERFYVFRIQLSKSVLSFQHYAQPFLLKETNHAFAFSPNDRGPVAAHAALDGLCHPRLHAVVTVLVRPGCPRSASAPSCASSRPAAGGSLAGLLQAALGLSPHLAALPAAGVGAAEPGQLPAH